MTEEKDRMEYLVRIYFNNNQSAMAKSLDYSQAHISALCNGNRNLSAEFVKLLQKEIPGLSADWLLNGLEPMIIESHTNRVEDREIIYLKKSLGMILDEKVENLEETVAELKKRVARLEKKIAKLQGEDGED